jgi:hypothetical protein
MVKINELVRPRNEVLTEGVEGRVDVYKAISGEGIEGNANRFLEITYLTDPLKEVLNEIDAKLKGKEGSKGVFVFSGGFGSGKSHHILTLYHLFNSSNIGNQWLKTQKYNFRVPNDTRAVLIQALSINPDYLWVPIFESLGHGWLNDKIKRFPTHNDIKKAVSNASVMIFLDEIESWFDALDDDKLENRNLNFLQNLIEVASNKNVKLCVFVSILPESLVRNQSIKGRINRDFVYWRNLYEIKEKDQIVLYRLFHLEDKKVNSGKIKKLIKEFILKYKQSGLFKDRSADTRRRMEELSKRMLRYYPFHPQVLDTLFEKFGSSTAYQRTRGTLYLLSSVIKDCYNKNEIILLSDISPERYPDISKLDADLAEKAIEDIRKTRELGVRLSEEILSVIFAKSIGAIFTQGASKEDLLYGCLNTKININELDAGLLNITSTAPHVHEREGKFVLEKDINVLVLIENEARLLKDKPTVIERIARIIKDEIKLDKVKTVCFDTDGIDDTNQTKIVFSLLEKSEDEIKKTFESKTYQNRIIFVNPKCKDVLRADGLCMNVARVIAIEELLPRFGKYKRTLEARKEHNLLEIKKKLKEKYGKVIHWQDSKRFMPISIDFDSGKIEKKLEETYDLTTYKEKILFLLNSRETGESLTVKDVKTQFYRTRGFPVVLDENLFKKAFDSLIDEEKIVLVSGADVFRKGRATVVLRDEYVVAKPEEIPEETKGVEAGERTTIRMRMPVDEAEITPTTGTEVETPMEGEVETSLGVRGLDLFNIEEFSIDESKPWSLQSRLDSELDESRDIREFAVTIKGGLKGKDVKDIVNEIIEKHEDDIHSMKLKAKVLRDD